MNPVKTKKTTTIFKLDGGTEENDLPVEVAEADGSEVKVFISTWEPSIKEREEIFLGKNVELIVWGTGHPPVEVRVEED